MVGQCRYPLHVIAKCFHPRPVARNRMILEIPPHHLLQPRQRTGNATVHPLAQLGSDILQLRCHSFADRLAVYLKAARLVVGPTDVGETEKIKVRSLGEIVVSVLSRGSDTHADVIYGRTT
jgi:hypothetical protein